MTEERAYFPYFKQDTHCRLPCGGRCGIWMVIYKYADDRGEIWESYSGPQFISKEKAEEYITVQKLPRRIKNAQRIV